MPRHLRCGISLAALAASLCFSAAAAEAQESADSSVPETVTVTGSRISTPGFVSPTPVTAISERDLALKGVGTITNLINDIPELAPFNGFTGSAQNIGASNLNLRGIGASRTLLLVDGRRFASTSPTGGVDTNVLPASLIKSVSVVTGGASAAYGSDAVAGVVEITLDDKFEGLKGHVQGGITPYGDNKELSASVQAGFGFLGDRGHVVAALDTYSTAGALQGDRPWNRDGWGIVTNPGYKPGNTTGQTSLILSQNVRLSQMTDGGVIIGGPLQNTQFGPGGAIAPFKPGAFAGATFAVGGDGADLGRYASIMPRIHRDGAYFRTSFDATPEITFWADMLYSVNRASNALIPNYSAANITITNQNAYLPSQIATMMATNGVTSFKMGRTNRELGFEVPNTNITAQRYSFGVDGHFGERWQWQAYAQYSFNNNYSFVTNNLKTAAFNNAIDSVRNPAAGGVAGVPVGAPVCRATLTAPDNGCVPINVFGSSGNFNLYSPNGDWSPSAVDYVSGTSFYNETQSEGDYALNVQGQPFSDWAGPVSVALGAEYRREAVGGTSDALSQAAGWRQVNASPLNGTYNVTEGYLETEIPLLRGVPLAESLDLNAAGRITSYSTSGTVETWKIGLNYQPIDELRFRGTTSYDIRAPNVSELFQARQQNTVNIVDPTTNLAYPNTLQLTGGNANLTPEVGKTLTAGGVYQPNWLPGFTISIDYYQLHLTGAITTLQAQTVVNNCYSGQTNLCSAISRDSTGKIVSVASTAFNAQSLATDGWDIEASHGFPVDDVLAGWNGDIRLHALASYTQHLTTSVNGVTTEGAGFSNPRWRWNATVTYSNDPLTVNVEGRWIGNSLISNTYVQGVDINNNQIDGRFTVDLSATYDIGDNMQLFGRVNNVFDIYPPISPSTTTVVHQRSNTLYDAIGRDFILGLRFHL